MFGFIRRLLAVSAVLLSAGCSAQPQEARVTIYAMDTVMSLTVYGENAAENAANAAAKINELSALWSVTDESSELYRLNHSGGMPMEVSAETAELIRFSLEMGEDTGGALDITLYPVLREWGFTTGEYRIPDEERISELLSARGTPEIYGSTVALPEGTELDTGAVAKGCTGDILAEQLRSAGVTSALLDLGGNIHAVGGRADGSDWRLGIKDPRGEGNIAVLELRDKAAVTSGDYERYFIGEDGVRYCHILDPKTGRPADSGLCSVTVIGEEGRLCDALSTALFVMGKDAAKEYRLSRGGFDMILIDTDGNILITEGIEEDFFPAEGFSGEVEVLRRQ